MVVCGKVALWRYISVWLIAVSQCCEDDDDYYYDCDEEDEGGGGRYQRVR